MSDLHIEFRPEEDFAAVVVKNASAPILALVGDIGLIKTDQYEKFLNDLALSKKFEKILVIMGNHESYGLDIDDASKRLRSICAKHPGVLHAMDREAVVINDVRVLGCTLWAPTPAEFREELGATCNDHHKIGFKGSAFTVAAKDDRHEQERKWLEAQIAEAAQKKQRVLVLTHHAPTLAGIQAPCEQEWRNSRIGMHGTDLSHVFSGSKVDTWVFGHTHWNCDHIVEECRIVSNQRGYPDMYMEMADEVWATNLPFDIKKVVTV